MDGRFEPKSVHSIDLGTLFNIACFRTRLKTEWKHNFFQNDEEMSFRQRRRRNLRICCPRKPQSGQISRFVPPLEMTRASISSGKSYVFKLIPV